MASWLFWEILETEGKLKLINYQWAQYGTKLDIMIQLSPPVAYVPTYPTLEQIKKEMKKPPKHQKRVA